MEFTYFSEENSAPFFIINFQGTARSHTPDVTSLNVDFHKVKVKCTLVQALRFCTGRTAHRGSRGIALPFHDHDTRRGEGSVSRPGRFYSWERPSTHCTGGWVDPRNFLDRCGIDPRTVQPVVSRCTDYATRPKFR